jgi:uncharacterized protein YkwD
VKRRLAALLLSVILCVTGLGFAQPAAALSSNQLANRLVASINAQRKAHHMAPLRVNRTLVKRATTHANLVRTHARLRNTFAGEPSLSTQLRRLGYPKQRATQAVAWSSTQHSLLRQPSRSKAVRARLLNRTYTQVGVAVRYVSSRHRYVLTVVFARPQSRATQYANSVLRQLNAERRAHGRKALTMNSALVRSAHRHNLTMAAHDQMSHQRPGELFYAQRIERAGYRYLNAGENIGWNSLQTVHGALQLETMMYNERPPNDGHRQNILSPDYVNVGIDVYFDRVNHKLWLTEDFGSR